MTTDTKSVTTNEYIRQAVTELNETRIALYVELVGHVTVILEDDALSNSSHAFTMLGKFGALEQTPPSFKDFSFLKAAGVRRLENVYRYKKGREILWSSLYGQLLTHHQDYVLYFDTLEECFSKNSRTHDTWEPLKNVSLPIFFITSEMLSQFLGVIALRGTRGFLCA